MKKKYPDANFYSITKSPLHQCQETNLVYCNVKIFFWSEFREKLLLPSQDSYPIADFSTISSVTRVA